MDRVRMMKIYRLKLLFFFLIVFSLVSCNDAIFYMITLESPLLKPLIGGSPTNFVEYNGKLHVASGKKIFSYGKNEQSGKIEWSNWKTLRFFIANLATAGDSLYVLYLSNDSGKIMRYYKSGDSSDEVNLSGNVQSIHASGNILFASVRIIGNNYSFYYREEGKPDFKEIPLENSNSKPIDYKLNGVASDSKYYYLCTFSGIFYVEKEKVENDKINSFSDMYVLKNEEDKYITGFTGIINLNSDCVAAISYNGKLYEISNAVISKEVGFDDGRYSTGALAIWRDKDDQTKSLLLASRNDDYYSITGYSNGYVEIELDTTLDGEGKATVIGIKSDAKFSEPGKNKISSIENNDRYAPSLGKKLINQIIQTSSAIDSNMTMFASTQQDGVWSYKNRDGLMLWNAEE